MGRNSWTAFVVLTMFLLMSSASGQGGADMDMSADQDTDASNDVDATLSDPSLVNPTNKQGYGRNVQTQLHLPKNKNQKTTSKPSVVEKNLGEQTVQAALQFGVLVRVFPILNMCN